MNTEQNKAAKANKGKVCAKATKIMTNIDLDKDKPFDINKRNGCHDPENPEPRNDTKVYYEVGSHSACLTLPNLYVIELPLEYEIILKYKDEEVRILGKPGRVRCNNIQRGNDPALKLIFDALAHNEKCNEDGPLYNPSEEEAA
jgi:hypothetical protein